MKKEIKVGQVWRTLSYGDVEMTEKFEKHAAFIDKDGKTFRENDYWILQNWTIIKDVEESNQTEGSYADYYNIPEGCKTVMDLIEHFEMNFSQGNILKSAFCLGRNRHEGTNNERELNKIIYFANRLKNK